MFAAMAGRSVEAHPQQADDLGVEGMTLARRYRVEALVGRGGFGSVYAGHHLFLDAPVAIKFLRTGAADDRDRRQEAFAAFLTEAQTVAQLRHPGIAAVMDSGVLESDGQRPPLAWMVLEWCEGETLARQLSRRRGQGGRSREECWQLMQPVLEAMAHAHSRGVAHRDLKPANVMITPQGARVLDFGIAKVMGEEEHEAPEHTETRDTQQAFTLAYAAPEQVSRTRTGPWTDVHALGLLLTELLVDAAPYGASTKSEIHERVFDQKRPTPGWHGVDAGAWEPVIARALALKPRQRQPHATALREELAAALSHRAVSAVTGPPARIGRQARWWWLVTGSMVGAALLVGALPAGEPPARLDRGLVQSVPLPFDPELIEQRLREAGYVVTTQVSTPAPQHVSYLWIAHDKPDPLESRLMCTVNLSIHQDADLARVFELMGGRDGNAVMRRGLGVLSVTARDGSTDTSKLCLEQVIR
jgi:hypothetical protein